MVPKFELTKAAIALLFSSCASISHRADVQSATDFGFSFLIPRDMKRNEEPVPDAAVVCYSNDTMRLELVFSGATTGSQANSRRTLQIWKQNFAQWHSNPGRIAKYSIEMDATFRLNGLAPSNAPRTIGGDKDMPIKRNFRRRM